MQALWSDTAIITAMLRFEAALAQAQDQCMVIPNGIGYDISQACASIVIDPAALAVDARRAGTLAIPLVKALKAYVAEQSPRAMPYVHFGATSQDVCDTALICLIQTALQQLRTDLLRLGDGLATLIHAHQRTAMLSRTLLQPAAPISFAWKLAGWLDSLMRNVEALAAAGEAARVLQFGGANGTLVSHGNKAGAVSTALAARLGLCTVPISWHGAHDRLARLGNELAVTCGMLGKMGRDISLLMQFEVAEVFEPDAPGRGGSSAMPHKRNPVSCMHMLDAAYRAPSLAQSLTSELAAEHERGLGNWSNALPLLADLFVLTGNSISAAVEAVEGLRIAPDTMAQHIESTRGVVYSEGIAHLLVRKLGPVRAEILISQGCAEAMAGHRTLPTVLLAIPEIRDHVSDEEMAGATSLSTHLDAAQSMAAQVVGAWRAHRGPLVNIKE